MIKHYCNATTGIYIGQFDSTDDLPTGSIAVNTGPDDARMVYQNYKWVAPADLLADASEGFRIAFETGGMTLTGGHSVSTSEAVQSKVASAIKHLEGQPEGATVSFAVSASVFVPMDLAAITAVFQEMAGHVQTAFTKQEAVFAKITSGEITALDQVKAEWA